MALLNEVVYTDPRLSSTLNSIKGIESHIEDLNKHKAAFEKDLEESIKTIQIINDYIDTNSGLPDAVYNCLVNEVRGYENSLDRYRNRITSTENNLEAYYKNLIKYKEQVKKYEASAFTVFTKDKLKRTLSSIKSINQKSVALGEDNHGVFLRWRYEGLSATITGHSFKNINFGEPVKISFEPIVVTTYLSGSIKITGGRNAVRHTGYSGRSIVHPHILSNNRPCLGDFEGPAHEALNDLDIETYASIMEMFLSQVAHDDAAGSHWYKWMFNSDRLDRANITGIPIDPDASDYERVRVLREVPAEHLFAYIQNEDGEITTTPFDTYAELMSLGESHAEAA